MKYQKRKGEWTINETGGLIIVLGILSLVAVGLYNSWQLEKKTTEEQNAIKAVVEPILPLIKDSCKSCLKRTPIIVDAPDSLPSLAVKGALVAWSIDDEKGIILDQYVTPDTLKDKKELTLLIRYAKRETVTGYYVPKDGILPDSMYEKNKASRTSQDICVIYWPGNTVVGLYCLVADPPKEAMLPGGIGGKAGDLDQVLRRWIKGSAHW